MPKARPLAVPHEGSWTRGNRANFRRVIKDCCAPLLAGPFSSGRGPGPGLKTGLIREKDLKKLADPGAQGSQPVRQGDQDVVQRIGFRQVGAELGQNRVVTQ